MSISTHPAKSKYFGSMAQAKKHRQSDEKIMKLGVFQSGSFGVYAKRLRETMVTVYMVCKK